MNCDDIKENLKSFLDDLLSEDEFGAFYEHMDACDTCRTYVRSIGSLSNQLWKLGAVVVPADFGATVLFKLKEIEKEVRKPKLVITKKWILGILIMTIIISAAMYGINYVRDRQRSRERNAMPYVTVEVTREQIPPSDDKATLLINWLKNIARTVGVSEKDIESTDDTAKGKKEAEKEVEKTTQVSGGSLDREQPPEGRESGISQPDVSQ